MLALLTLVLASQPADLGARLEAAYSGAQLAPLWLDGRMAYVDHRGDVFVVDLQNGRKVELARGEDLSRAVTAAGGAYEPRSVRLVGLDGLELRVVTAGELWSVSQGVATRLEGRGGVEALPHYTTSTDGGQRVQVTLANDTDRKLELFWVTGDGHRVSYGLLAPGERRSQNTYAGHVWLFKDVASGEDVAIFRSPDLPDTIRVTGQEPRPTDPPAPERGVASPDGKRRAWIEAGNLVVDGRTLTVDGKPGDEYAEWSLAWSPDSSRLVAFRVEEGQNRQIPIVEARPNGSHEPKLTMLTYDKPGDKMPRPRPMLVEVETGRVTAVPEALHPNPVELGDVRWNPDSSGFQMIYVERGYPLVRLIEVDRNGSAQPLIEERSSTFVDYHNKTWWHRLEGGDVLWASERSGWNHLYLFDRQTATLRAITTGDWLVRSVVRVDEERREVVFEALGLHPGQDPYHVHLAKVGFEGGPVTPLTDGDGTHRVQWSPDGRSFVASWSRTDHPHVHELRHLDGTKLAILDEPGVGRLEREGWRRPERFVAKGRDGVTDIWGVVYRPTDWDPAKRYPVLEHIYAGPHGHHVPKSFDPYTGAMEMAELGFIVVQIDGMGTNWRSKAFHDVCWKNIADAGFPDRKLWIQALAATDPSLDLDRVGIYGGSAGGQNAMRALLDHGDFYKVAVADCGCHDNRVDKRWWNEMWMGWPVDESYVRSSNVEDAHKLQGALMLVVGEVDSNVDPASTMQVVDALIKADKDFELLVMPGVGHGATGHPYAQRRMRAFLVEHLAPQR